MTTSNVVRECFETSLLWMLISKFSAVPFPYAIVSADVHFFEEFQKPPSKCCKRGLAGGHHGIQRVSGLQR